MRLFITQLCLLTISSICLAQQDSSLRSTLGQQLAAQETAPKLLPPTKIGIDNLPPVSEDGYWIEGAPLNEVFQYLARRSNLQFFHNNEINTPEYIVTGHLKIDDPKKQMEELAIIYGLSIYEQEKTVSLVTEQQQIKLPVEVMSYPLKYLRGASPSKQAGAAASNAASSGPTGAVADFEKLKSIIKPLLTREVGLIEFEEKTNTLLVTDNKVKLQRVSKLLLEIDKPKQQIVVNVRVLRIKRGQGRQTGVDWSRALGDSGLSIGMTQSLNALFNLPNTNSLIMSGASTAVVSTINKDYTDGAGLVFDSLRAQAIIRALEQSDLVTQEACPTIITEDNEQGVVSIVDRFPIITSNVSATTAGQTINEQVRYKIDQDDPNSTEEPDKSREIGVTLSVTPTLLPDGTVRMKLRPRVAKIVELVSGRGSSGAASNAYPRVSESTVEAISRIPSGQSLFLGGFYDYSNTAGSKKVPILGSIPFIKNLFTSNSRQMEQVSLVFIITPSVYDATDVKSLQEVNKNQQAFSEFLPIEVGGSSPSLLPDANWSERPKQNGNISSTINVYSDRAKPQSNWLKRIFTRTPVPKPPSATLANPPR
jgi:Flp pilus assembly secretin CpaC